MFCNLKKIFYLALTVSVIGIGAGRDLYAQNVTLEEDNMPQLSNDNQGSDFLGVDESIPDELSLPQEDDTTDNILVPAADQGNFIGFDESNSMPIENSMMAPDLNTPVPLNHNDLPLDDGNMPLTGPNANLPPLGGSDSAPSLPSTSASLGSVTSTLANDNLGEGILSQIDNELFSQMSDLEKQTALLTLELRREKIKNEIAAIKAQRQKAIDEEQAKKEEKERKRIEWEKEQEAKILREKKALQEVLLRLERLRQQKVLKAYKESMLDAEQKWIKNNAKLYEQLLNVENDRKNLIDGLKSKMAHISALASKAQRDAETAKENYQREVKNLQTQISILKSRLEAEIAEKKNDKTNPFAQPEVVVATEEETPKLNEEYVIMEIRGKGDKLTAKLINKGGDSFLVRDGTVLQTGHRIDEITQTYVRADFNGAKDYLYFSAGGILEKEPAKSDIKPKGNNNAAKKNVNSNLRDTTMVNQGVPSLGSGMFVR